MAKQVNTTVIGGFVISAIALLVIAILIFGGGKYFKKTITFVLFFDSSVKGLNVGAPVVFRGVNIGAVKDVMIFADSKTLDVNIPVVIEVEPDRFQVTGERLPKDPYEKAKILIKTGIRGQLTMQSFVTGQLMVALDFTPDTKVQLTGIDVGYPELPTRASDLEQLSQTLKKVPIEEIVSKLMTAITNVEKILNAPELIQTIRNIETASANANQLILDMDSLVKGADKKIDPLARDLQATMGDARRFINNLDGEAKTISGKAQDGLDSAKTALDQATHTLRTYETLVDDRSELRHEMDTTLNEISQAARSLRAFTDYLEQHPEALLQGKGSGGGQ